MQASHKAAIELLRVYALSNPDKMPGELKELTAAAKAVATSLFLHIEEAVAEKLGLAIPPQTPVRRDVERTGKSDITSTEDIDALKQALSTTGRRRTFHSRRRKRLLRWLLRQGESHEALMGGLIGLAVYLVGNQEDWPL